MGLVNYTAPLVLSEYGNIVDPFLEEEIPLLVAIQLTLFITHPTIGFLDHNG